MRNHILCAFVFAMTLLQQVYAVAAVTPANPLNTQTVYGPKTVAAGKVYSDTFKAQSNVDGVISVINGSGRDLHPSACSGNILQKAVCLIENAAKSIEVSLFRAKSIEISLNNQIVIAHNVLDPAAAGVQIAIRTKTGTPVNAVVNNVKADIVGSPFAPVTFEIKAQTQAANQLPIARMSANPALGVAPLIVNFSGLLSSDADGSIASYDWNFGDPSSGVSNTATGAMSIHTFAVAGNYTVTLVVKDNQGASASVTSVVKVALNKPPVAVFSATPESGPAPLMVVLNASQSSDQDGTVDTFIWDFGDGSSGSGVQVNHTFNQPGQFTVKLYVRDDKGAEVSAQKSITVAAANVPPTAVIRLSKSQGISPFMVSFDGSQSTDSDGSIALYSWDFGDGGTATGQRVNHDFATGNFTVTLKVKDNWGAENSTTIAIAATDPVLPPKPEQIAPPLSPTKITLPAEMTEFLYKGDNPIQTGVAEGTIDERFVSVIRGKVLQEDGSPLSGAVVKILGDDRYGQTLTREDGQYDLAVNGGGSLVISFERNGYYGVQRKVTSSHLAFAVLDDVFMLRPDPKVTVVATNSDVPQVAKGSVSSDSDGTRTATVLMPSQTGASLRMPDGSLIPVPQLSIRAKEYTVGPDGPKRMPAELPSTSAYTYAVQLSADEALAKGASGIEFSKPVSLYVENFIGFATGDAVPVGIYNSVKGYWEASKNGRVISINSIVDGKAVLDVTGSGIASSSDLQSLGIDDEELRTIASSYTAGTSLWRVRLAHFSAVDINAFQKDVADVDIPSEDPTNPTESQSNGACPVPGSIINPDTRTLGESVGIIGTPYTLNYSTSRVPGRSALKSLDIKVTPGDLSNFSNLKGVDLKVVVAGQEYKESFSSAPGQVKRFVWNGKDSFGRELKSGQVAEVSLSYRFPSTYLIANRATADDSTFAFLGPGLTVTNITSRQETIFTRMYKAYLGANESVLQQGLGGWTFNVHHHYDPVTQTIYFGDGSKRSAKDVGNLIKTVVGTGVGGYSGDGGLATAARMRLPTDMFIGKDNSIYFRDGINARIRKVNPDGIISTVIGNGTRGDGVDGSAALQTNIDAVGGIALDVDGSFYLAETSFHRIKRVSPDGLVTVIGGTGVAGFSGDGGSALLAKIKSPTGLVVKEGNVYFNDAGNFRVRVIRPNGEIQTVAGNGIDAFAGDGGAAVDASLRQPFGLSLGSNGDLYLADLNVGRIRRIDRSGFISTVAGGGTSDADGIPATQALLIQPTRAVLSRDNTMYISNYVNPTIRKVGPDGIISTHAGTTLPGAGNGQNEIAGRAKLIEPSLIAIGPDDSIYIGDGLSIRKISRAFAGVGRSDVLIPSKDGSEIYVFDFKGKHLETRHALTGATKYKFSYDVSDRLASIADGDGNTTSVSRNQNGEPIQISGPFGHVTSVSLFDDGYLSSITNPNSEVHSFTYFTDGLLASFKKPKGNVSLFTYDSLGQLMRDEDAAGGFRSFAESIVSGGYAIPSGTAEGRRTQIVSQTDAQNHQILTRVNANGISIKTIGDLKGATFFIAPTRNISTIAVGEPRLGGAVQVTSNQSITLNSGQQLNKTNNRSVSYRSNSLFDFVQTDSTVVNGKTSTKVFDAQAMSWTETSPQGRTRQTFVDRLGRPIRIHIPGIDDQIYSYNGYGKLERISNGSRSTLYSYDSRGRMVSTTNALGGAVIYTYDDSDRMVSRTTPGGSTLISSYDKNGNLVGIVPDGKPQHVMEYNVVDLQSAYVPPTVGQSQAVQYRYNLDKQIISLQAAPGIFANYIYGDNSKQLSRIVTNKGNYEFAYSASTGNLERADSPDLVSTTFTYNGKYISSVSNSGQALGSLAIAFDNDFRVASTSVNASSIVSNQYDGDGLLISSGPLSLSYSSQNNQLLGTRLSNVGTDYSYNSLGELSAIVAQSSGVEKYSSSYIRDAIGRIKSKTETIGGQTSIFNYTYDLNGRLASVENNGVLNHYSYDGNGNRVESVRAGQSLISVYDDQDRVIKSGQTTYSYEVGGSLKDKVENGSTTTYDHDIFGNLKGATLQDGRAIKYVFDGKNRRVGKLINGVRSKFWVYESQLRIAAELDSTGQIVSRFIYGAVQSPQAMIKNGVTYKIISDHIGSVRLVVNASNGEVAQSIEYDEYGRVLSDSNPGFQPFGFAGGLYDPDTKLVRFGARDYDPELGRWTSKDSLRFGGGSANLYDYVLNDPINFTDAEGKCLPCLAVAAGALVGAVATVTGSAIAGTLTYDNFVQTAVIGGAAGAVAVLTSGAAAAAATVTTIAELATVEVASSLTGAVAATAVDVGASLLLSGPPPETKAQDVVNGITNPIGPTCPDMD